MPLCALCISHEQTHVVYSTVSLKSLVVKLALPILRDGSSSSLAFSETALPQYLKVLHLTGDSVPALISSGSYVDNWKFGS